MTKPPKCSDHPDAPHGFCRNASHSIGRYVCECEGWEPDEPAVPQEPVAYLAWRDGKPCWDGDDCVCRHAVWPVDHDDDRTSMPVYLAPQPQRPRLTPEKLNQMWNDAINTGNPTAGDAHLRYARAIEKKVLGEV